MLIWLGNKDDGEDTTKAWECRYFIEVRWPHWKELDFFQSKPSTTIGEYRKMQEEMGPAFKTSFTKSIEEINYTFNIPPVESGI